MFHTVRGRLACLVKSERGLIPLKAKGSSRDKRDGECEEGKEAILRETRGEMGGRERAGSQRATADRKKGRDVREGGHSPLMTVMYFDCLFMRRNSKVLS